jgi:hypothetical protein
MFFVGLLLFTVFLSLHALDEHFCHRERALSRTERAGRLGELLLWLTLHGLVIFAVFTPALGALYAALATSTLLFLTRHEWRGRVCTPREAGLHALQYLLSPVLLLTLGAMWPVIDGVSTIVGWMLPLSLDGLRLLVWLQASLLALALAYEWRAWRRATPAANSLPPA